MKTYNIACIGDPGVGKTSAVKALKSVWYPSMKYVATVGAEVHPMVVRIDTEQIVFNLWDIGGKYPAPPEGTWQTKQIDATCVFYDTTNMNSFNRAMNGWLKHTRGRVWIVGTKIDKEMTDTSLAYLAEHHTGKAPELITATDPAGIEQMFVKILRELRA